MSRPSIVLVAAFAFAVASVKPGLGQSGSETPPKNKAELIQRAFGKRPPQQSGNPPNRRGGDSQQGPRGDRGAADRGNSGPPLSIGDRNRGDQDGRTGNPRSGREPDRRDSDRSRLGITIGPGGLQIYRGPSGVRPGIGSRYPYYFGRDPRRRGWPGYYGNGWGIIIQTRPQVQDRVQQVFVPQVTDEPAQPPVPTSVDVAGMPDAELRGLLLFAAEQLDDELNEISTGAGWRSYLLVADLRRLIPAPETAPPAPGSEARTGPPVTESAKRELAEIQERFDQTAANAEYQQISGMWGFQTIQVALREYLIPARVRLHKQLEIAADLLTEELQQFETGPSWVSHLNLTELKRLSTIQPQELSGADHRQFQELIAIFNRVAAEPGYYTISELPGFRMALHVMRTYLTQLEPPAPPVAPPAAPASKE